MDIFWYNRKGEFDSTYIEYLSFMDINRIVNERTELQVNILINCAVYFVYLN